MRRTLLIVSTFVLYGLVVAVTIWALVAARRGAIASFDNAAEQARWDEFRAEMDNRHLAREALREEIARGSGQPIAASPPKTRSARPPALELLTKHFAACVVVSVLGVSGLFAVIWGLVVGAVLRPGRPIAECNEGEMPPSSRRCAAGQLR
jgi:hypothetical protein